MYEYLLYIYYIDYYVLQCVSVRRGYALNLSILVSAGKETNEDSLSSGERTGMNDLINLFIIVSPPPQSYLLSLVR